MQCSEFEQRLDDYLDDALSKENTQVVEAHAAHCDGCAQQMREAVALRHELRDLPVPAARADFEQRLLARVRKHYSPDPRRRQHIGFASGFATAAVAGLLIWLTTTLYLPGTSVEQPQILVLGMHQTQTVRLLFEAPTDIEQASLSISLPDHLRLQGYPEQRQLSWRTPLQRGQNVLALPVRAIGPGQGELVTRLSFGGKTHTHTVMLKTEMQGALNLQQLARQAA